MIRPNALQRALAYVANGDLPPALALDVWAPGALSTALCLAAGLWIGGILS
jgi:hypothetical protein